MNPDLVLTVCAVVFFLLAALPHLTAPQPIRWEWLAAMCLTVTLLV